VASAWLLSSGGHHHHGHSHGHAHDDHHEHEEEHRILTPGGAVVLSIFETNHPPVFRLRKAEGGIPASASVDICRPDGERQTFAMVERGGFLESVEEIPEPHAFAADVLINGFDYPVVFEEHGHAAHGAAHRDNNMRAAVVHVVADAAVSVLVIAGLLMARIFGWLWMDPLAGIIGAVVIASWAYGLVRDTGAILLDMNPDRGMTENVRKVIEAEGDRLTDLHVWRLGPGHLGAIVSVSTANDRTADFYREKLAEFSSLSHPTVEVTKATRWVRDVAGEMHNGFAGPFATVRQLKDIDR